LQDETPRMLGQPDEVWLITLAVRVVEDCQHGSRLRRLNGIYPAIRLSTSAMTSSRLR
jgi:hypothetical protein